MTDKNVQIRLSDLMALDGNVLVPREPISLYRYVEHLVELAILRKFSPRTILEVGPGTYPVFAKLPPEYRKGGTLVDYNPQVLEYCSTLLEDGPVECIALDIENGEALRSLGRKWDLVISNGVVEHIRNDRAHVEDLRAVLADDGTLVCVTVLHEWLFNDWDRAVGHYRRYSVAGITELFKDFSAVQIIQTSLLQELARSLFLGRIRHLVGNSTETNNRLFGAEVGQFSRPPYSGIFGLVRWLLPVYLMADWMFSRLLGGIVIVVARK